MPSTITERLQGLTTSVAVKAPCKQVSESALTLSGEQTIGGVSCVSGDRVLYALSGGSVSNGIWVVSTGAWTRAKDFDGSRDVVTGTLILVRPGSADAKFYSVNTTGDIVPGTTSLTIEQASLDGTTLGIELADSATVGNGDALVAVKRTLTGAVATTQHVVNEARVVNVQSDFGAVADGSTSNTAVVQTACDALTNGGAVIIPPNVVWTRSGVTIPANVTVIDLAATSKTIYTASNFYRFANIGLTIGAPTTGTRIFGTNSVDGTEYLVFGLDTGANPATYICAGGGGSIAFTDETNNTKASINVNDASTNNPGFLAGFSAPNKGGFSANGDSSLGNGLGMRIQDTRTTGGDWDFFVDVSGGEARYGLYEADSGVTLFEMTPTLIDFNLPVASIGSRQRGKAIVNNNGSATYTVTATTSYVGFTGTNVATLGFTFPAGSAAIDGHEVAIYTQAAVGTSSTWASTGATFVGAPATLTAGSVTRFIYHHATTQWLPR